MTRAMKRKTKRGRIRGWPISGTPVMQADFGGNASKLLSVTGWRAWPLIVLSCLIGHALFILLVRLFCKERDAGGMAVFDPKLSAVFGNYMMFRSWRGFRTIQVYGALTPEQRRVFVSGRISYGYADTTGLVGKQTMPEVKSFTLGSRK